MEIHSGYATRRPFLFIIIIYLLAGLAWLHLGKIIIGTIDRNNPNTDLRFLYDLKNISFMFFTAAALYFLLRARQKNLQKAESNYFKLFEASPGAVYVIDKSNFRFLAVNNVMVNKYGYSRAQLLKMTALDIRPENERERLSKYLLSDHDEGHETGIWLHQKKNGDLFYMLISHHSIKFKNIDAYIVIAINVDQSVRNEKRLKEIAWTNSHEIRKPVSNILGLVALMKTDASVEIVDSRVIEMLISSANELDTVVKKINSHAEEWEKTS
ncbi:PAS domain-containing protein [Pedobacter nyackensis]|uniref:histidine kinase n=1 Tax=Pedobacter nyackensis TaxID=475255 RepID=A0A1W2EDT3_9SPHI|nr:PAS domain-containing protein [Pedobacter nyackensis]SMD07552.1 PAS domain S-box-containing protein [Pedobacter nyackensis]